jgi:SAM-dependent methyltransferase
VSWQEGSADGPACLVCAGTRYTRRPILWPALIAEWEISADEADIIDRQQGVCCEGCGCNLRSIALAGGICDAAGHPGTLRALAAARPALRILEINPAGGLSGLLRSMPGTEPVAYPGVDMRALPHADATFDLVVHSDTLEHVPEPDRGLAECRRVLRPGGWLAMTVPIVPGRLTRSRRGMPPSYHGAPDRERDDHLVHTEFGADAWTLLAEAGFQRMGLRVFAWPCAACWTAQR